MISARTGSMLSVKQAAQRLFGECYTEADTSRIYRGIKCGQIHAQQIGGRKYIPVWQIETLEGVTHDP